VRAWKPITQFRIESIENIVELNHQGKPNIDNPFFLKNVEKK